MPDDRSPFIPHGPILDAVEVAFNWAGADGVHHKQWCINAMLRCLLTCSQYDDYCVAWENEHGNPWDTGAPS